MSWISQFVDPQDMKSAETLPRRKKAFGRILTSDAIVPGTIAHESKIPRNRLRSVNTPLVLLGDIRAQHRSAENSRLRESEHQRKMQNQLHERSLRRQFLQERAEYRKVVQLQSGQQDTTLHEPGQRSNSFMQSSLPSQGSGWSKKPVVPGDVLMSIERFCRLPGRGSDDAGGLVPNGSMSYDGGERFIEPTFSVDDKQREVRKVVTGGPSDRLHYSDGASRVLLDPKVVRADPLLASKPLLLRNGSSCTIGVTAPRGVETARGRLEVPQLSSYHLRSERDGCGDDLSYTTSQSPRAWEQSVRSREKYLEKRRATVVRPDRDAVAEYYALRKVEKEQAERRALYERLAEHRDGMLRKMEERQVRRLCLQVKAGQVHPEALLSTSAAASLFGTQHDQAGGVEGVVGSAPSLEEVLSGPWSGSWTAHSQYAGSLTHNATKGHVRMLHDPHRYRKDH